MRFDIFYKFDTIEMLWKDQGNEFGAIAVERPLDMGHAKHQVTTIPYSPGGLCV